MDNDTKATITWLVGLAGLPGLYYLGLYSIEHEHVFGPYFIAGYVIAMFIALYGADKATEFVGTVPIKLPEIVGNGDGLGGDDDGDDRQ